MLGSIGNSVGNDGNAADQGRPRFKGAAQDAKKLQQQFDQLLEHDWSELPYAMMRITAARRPWDGKRVYWTLLGLLRGRTNERGMRMTLARMKKVLES